MSKSKVNPEALLDKDSRHRIVTELETSLLVEAGAGSGKTRVLAHRIIAIANLQQQVTQFFEHGQSGFGE